MEYSIHNKEFRIICKNILKSIFFSIILVSFKIYNSINSSICHSIILIFFSCKLILFFFKNINLIILAYYNSIIKVNLFSSTSEKFFKLKTYVLINRLKKIQIYNYMIFKTCIHTNKTPLWLI